MRVLVTGATGFVGCHSAAAVVDAGHELRLLVRDSGRAARALAPFGIEADDLHIGSVTDPEAVTRALEGCDAVLHAAGLLTFDRSRAEEMQRTNVGGTELVLGTALELGLDPVIHVSSIVALFPPEGPRFTPNAPVREPRDMYARSKAAAERSARSLQERGVPVVIVYPGNVWGPDDPTLGDGVLTMVKRLASGLYPSAPGGVPITDVRDLARVHAAALEPGRGPRRYMFGGHFVTHRELAATFEQLTGRRLLKPQVPAALLRGIGRVGDWLRDSLGVAVGGYTYESMLLATRLVPCDSSRAEAELGVRPRPLEETLRDSLVWLLERGVLEPSDLGALAAGSPG